MADKKQKQKAVYVNGRAQIATRKSKDGTSHEKWAINVAVHVSALKGALNSSNLRTKNGPWNFRKGLYFAEVPLPPKVSEEALSALIEGRGRDDNGKTNNDVELTFRGKKLTNIRVFVDGERGFDIEVTTKETIIKKQGKPTPKK